MAKRTQGQLKLRPRKRALREQVSTTDRNAQLDLVEVLFDIFTKAGWQALDRNSDRPFGGDLLLTRSELDQQRRYAIEVKTNLDMRTLNDIAMRYQEMIRRTPYSQIPFDELWVISGTPITTQMRRNPHTDRHFRVLDVDELRKLLIVPKPPKSKRAKTRIGQAIEANEREIRLAVAGLLLQIEAKIEALRHARLNSPESQEELTDLELMKSKLDRILVMLDTFAKDKTAEKETVKSVTTFRDDVKELWKKHQDQIVTTTFKASVFVAAVGVLSAFKADSAAAIATAGYIIGGKSPKDALKKAKKKISDWAG